MKNEPLEGQNEAENLEQVAIFEAVEVMETALENLKNKAQYFVLEIIPQGTSVTFVKDVIHFGERTRSYKNDTFFDPESAEWRGVRGFNGAEAGVYFKIDDENSFSYHGYSRNSRNNNESSLRLDGVDEKKYEVFFVNRGNITKFGALGHVTVKVRKKH